jgi:hypothetical protein
MAILGDLLHSFNVYIMQIAIYSTPEDGYIVAETCSDSKYRTFVYTLLHIDGITQFVVNVLRCNDPH